MDFDQTNSTEDPKSFSKVVKSNKKKESSDSDDSVPDFTKYRRINLDVMAQKLGFYGLEKPKFELASMLTGTFKQEMSYKHEVKPRRQEVVKLFTFCAQEEFPEFVVRDYIQKEMLYAQMQYLDKVYAKLIERLGLKYNVNILESSFSEEELAEIQANKNLKRKRII